MISKIQKAERTSARKFSTFAPLQDAWFITLSFRLFTFFDLRL